MARATEEEIRKIIDICEDITDLQPFIDAAGAVVDAQCPEITEAIGTIVENWLAAHFVAIRDMRSASESVSGVSQSFQYRVDLGLQVTMYGQQAMMLDNTGCLSKWNNDVVKGRGNQQVGGFWAGTETH